MTASLAPPPDRPQWHMSLQPDAAVSSHARELETKTNHVISFVPTPPRGHLPRWSLACTHPQERQRAPPRDCPTPLGGLCGATRRRDQHIPSRAHRLRSVQAVVSLPSLRILGEHHSCGSPLGTGSGFGHHPAPAHQPSSKLGQEVGLYHPNCGPSLVIADVDLWHAWELVTRSHWQEVFRWWPLPGFRSWVFARASDGCPRGTDSDTTPPLFWLPCGRMRKTLPLSSPRRHCSSRWCGASFPHGPTPQLHRCVDVGRTVLTAPSQRGVFISGRHWHIEAGPWTALRRTPLHPSPLSGPSSGSSRLR